MSLAQYFLRENCGLSFELFPPKNDAGVEQLLKVVEQLAAYEPDFFTCTYGAGGSTQTRTLEVASLVKEKFGFPVATHLTCVGSTVEQLRSYLASARDLGVDHVVALRGDPPKGETEFTVTDGGLKYANELVDLIRADFPDMGVAVAGYPEVHQEAVDRETDMVNLKRKVDAGADIIVTQLFYQNDDFYRFRDDCLAAGIDVPIVPGILPVTNLAQIKRITSMCKAALPQDLAGRLAENEDLDWQFKVGVEFAVEQVNALLASGVAGIHFYVLNQSKATAEVLRSAGLRTLAT
jgi:methylenetetrahydrofolate reductase (NADPH)